MGFWFGRLDSREGLRLGLRSWNELKLRSWLLLYLGLWLLLLSGLSCDDQIRLGFGLRDLRGLSGFFD